MRSSLNACPLCGVRIHADDIPDELMEAARRHLEEPKEAFNPLPLLPSTLMRKLLLAVLGIPIGVISGGVCVILTAPLFLIGGWALLVGSWHILLGIFGVGFVIAMGAWFLAFRIWPFHRG